MQNLPCFENGIEQRTVALPFDAGSVTFAKVLLLKHYTQSYAYLPLCRAGLPTDMPFIY